MIFFISADRSGEYYGDNQGFWLIPEIQERVMEEANTMLRKLRGIELTALAFDSFRMADPDTGTIRTIQLASVMRPQ